MVRRRGTVRSVPPPFQPPPAREGQGGGASGRDGTIPHSPSETNALMVFEKFIRSTGLAVGLMVFEQFIRSTALAVGLKPSARGCEGRLRGLERMMYSKTISPRLRDAKAACAAWSG